MCPPLFSFLHPLLFIQNTSGGTPHRYSSNKYTYSSTENTFLVGMKYGELTWRLPFWVAAFILGTYALQNMFSERTVLMKWYDADTAYSPQSTRKAYEESDGFFTEIQESEWEKLTERVRNTPNCAGNCAAEAAHVWYQNNWEPSFTCQHERRVGRWGDGGKWICDPHRIAANNGSCLVYSIGSNNDFSFEEGILRDISPACEIHTFDPTVGNQPSNLPKGGHVHFHPWGLSDRVDGDYKTFGEMAKTLGHAKQEIDIMKIDCEGCEWSSFKSWFEGGISVRQILIELHSGTEGGPDAVPALAFMTYLQKAGYVIFHKEPNTLGCRGECIEYAFIRLRIPRDG